MMAATTETRFAVSVPEAAELLGIARNTAYAAVARGEIPSVRVGKRIVIPMEWLRGWLEHRADEAAA
jgi:excisionase family DNA binding protein